MKKKSNTGRLLLLVITLLLVAIVIVISVSISQSQDINDTANRVSQTEKILLHTEKLIKAVLDNETGVKGYIITGQKTFQEPLIKSKKELFTELGHLKILTDGNPI
ncbi:CHASE3 domain-containing protein [Ferruginibacter sp.]|uniref:CHASE3 domain-containing protein n=1 Tax=Ferruginibacter sp. TaxID=1940288 RepID=UPI00265B4134|nr:CHASE3 domain-containing protein [Ferruginibacter sp.]